MLWAVQPACLCTGLLGLQVCGLIKIKINLQAETPWSCMQSVFEKRFQKIPVRDKEGNGSENYSYWKKNLTSERGSAVVFITGIWNLADDDVPTLLTEPTAHCFSFIWMQKM